MKRRIIVTFWIIVMSLILPCIVFAGSVTVVWVAGQGSDPSHYMLYYGTSSRVYEESIKTFNTTQTITGLEDGVTYYFAVTAVDYALNESGFSNEGTTSQDLMVEKIVETKKTK